MGAGVIPFSVHRAELLFLFQIPYAGRKAGYLVDFGGGGDAAEDYRDTAVREFVEETETMYFEDDLETAQRTPLRIREQIQLVDRWFEKTLEVYPHWWCRRKPGKRRPPKDWISYFIYFPYRDIAALNRQWDTDNSGRFKKRRYLVWVPVDDLLQYYESDRERLWKRVRQLNGAPELLQEIRHACLSGIDY